MQVATFRDVTDFRPPFDCIPRALDVFEAGLERGDIARNQLVLGFQPAVRVFISRMLRPHKKVRIIAQEYDDILTEVNLWLLTKTFEDIRHLRTRHNPKRKGRKTLKPVRGAGARRSARVVRTILQRLVGRVVKRHIQRRLNEYPAIDVKNLSQVFEWYVTDRGRAARSVEQDLDRLEVKAAVSTKTAEHLSFRRRSSEVADVAERICEMALWERYQNCDALAADWE